MCEFNYAFLNWKYQAHLIWKIGRSKRPTWKCGVSTIMFVCQFCATLLPTAPYLLHDPFVADTLFCLRKNASKSGIQGGGFANTHNVAIWCVLGRRIYPSPTKKESVAKRKQLLIMFSVHHCNPLFEEVGCGCLVRSVCPLQMKKSKINLVNSQLGLEKVRNQNDRLIRQIIRSERNKMRPLSTAVAPKV